MAAAIALFIPWPGSNASLILGWILTLVGCAALLASPDQARRLGTATFVASVVYLGIIILFFGLALQAAARDGDD
jgi:multisubunit Na+/H+ antiporter MnhG subunit